MTSLVQMFTFQKKISFGWSGSLVGICKSPLIYQPGCMQWMWVGLGRRKLGQVDKNLSFLFFNAITLMLLQEFALKVLFLLVITTRFPDISYPDTLLPYARLPKVMLMLLFVTTQIPDIIDLLPNYASMYQRP